jgi:hypothetical protein
MPGQPTADSVHDDLAFMRSLVDGGGGQPSVAGAAAYSAAGLLYGFQCLFHLGQALGWIRIPDWATLTFVVFITAAFLAVLIWVIRKDKLAGMRGSSTNRGINAAFSGAGMANTAMIVVFAYNAIRLDDFSIWLLYPAVVFALQGAVWYVAHILRRRRWMLWTAIGWIAGSVGLGLLVAQPIAYLALCSVALIVLMAWPGWIMVREARANG